MLGALLERAKVPFEREIADVLRRLVRNQRWNSPLFLSGESYGTTRAAHLAGWLADEGIALNGIALLSSVLNFEANSSYTVCVRVTAL